MPKSLIWDSDKYAPLSILPEHKRGANSNDLLLPEICPLLCSGSFGETAREQ